MAWMAAGSPIVTSADARRAIHAVCDRWHGVGRDRWRVCVVSLCEARHDMRLPHALRDAAQRAT
jgi:hypothetical protein